MEEQAVYHDGWEIEYGGERPELFHPALYEQALDFVNKKEAEGSKVEITYYVTTLGRIKPLYEKPITKELLSQMSRIGLKRPEKKYAKN